MKETRYRRYRKLALVGNFSIICYFIDRISDTGNWWYLLGVAAFTLSMLEITCSAVLDRIERLKQVRALKAAFDPNALPELLRIPKETPYADDPWKNRRNLTP